ncbi:putative protein, DegV family [Candidatus Tiddalikarchaeum anstoanum]|nr:putative protein, DegV family [Candidatus Tiddalikarchaeum anstoanum]
MRKLENIKIITDETIDFYPSFNEKEIVVIKNHLFLNGKEVSLTKKEFYEKITDKKNHFTTSQANPEDFLEVFKKYSDYKIIVITATSKMSGINNSANIAKKEMPNNDIAVIDSESLSAGLSILADLGLHLIKEGESYDNIVKKLENLKHKIKLFFLLTNLDYLVSSGRVNKIIGFLGKVVNMKPLLEIKEGVLTSAGAMILSKDMVNSFYEFLENKIRNTHKIFIIHNNLDAEMRALKSKLGRGYDIEIINFLNTLLGVYSGPECLAVGWVEE